MLPAGHPGLFCSAGVCLRSLPQTCPKQVGIRLMFLVNPRYHRIECDSCLTTPCRVPANLDNPALGRRIEAKLLPMSPLLDQSALTDLAERLVAVARRAGAAAARGGAGGAAAGGGGGGGAGGGDGGAAGGGGGGGGLSGAGGEGWSPTRSKRGGGPPPPGGGAPGKAPAKKAVSPPPAS